MKIVDRITERGKVYLNGEKIGKLAKDKNKKEHLFLYPYTGLSVEELEKILKMMKSRTS